MPLPNNDTLKTKILLLFGTRSLLSAKAIHGLLRKKAVHCSLQAVYRELRALIDESIVQKIGQSYALNTAWALQMQAFANSAARASFSEEAGLFLAAKQKKQSWKFESLLDMDVFWGHIALYLFKRAENKAFLAWHPYAWFYLFHKETEITFQRSLRLMGGRFCLMVGNSCFLNRWATQFMERDKITYSLAPGPFQDWMDSYMNIIGDHVITVKLKAATAKKLEQIFKNTHSIEALSLGALTELFTKEGHCTLTLEHNPKKAKELRGKFSRYFGEEF